MRSSLNPVERRSSTRALSSPTWAFIRSGNPNGRLAPVDLGQARTGPLFDAGLDGTAPGPGRLLVGDALAVFGGVKRDSGVAPVPHEAAGEPEHLGGALMDHASVAEDHRRSGPGRGLRQPDDAGHDLPALHFEPDPSLDDTALADFPDYLHGPSPSDRRSSEAYRRPARGGPYARASQ